MFLVRFFTRSIVGVVVGIIVLAIAGTVLFALTIGALAVSGGPGDCVPGNGPLIVDAAHAAAFKQKWSAFNTVLDAGSRSTVTLSESELSSRADSYLREKNAPLKEPRICIHDGSGEAQATISFLGLTASFKVTGTLDLSGVHPRTKIDSMTVGNVPGWLLSPARSYINGQINSQLNDVTLDHRYTATLKAGEAEVAGTP